MSIRFEVKTQGKFLGKKIKYSRRRDYSKSTSVTTSMTMNTVWDEAIFAALPTTTKAMLSRVTPIMFDRLKELDPKMREMLIKGSSNLSKELTDIGSIKRVEGLANYESTDHGTHRPHKDIPDPLSRLVNNKGLRIVFKKKANRFTILSDFKNTRNGLINFHNKMRKVPRASTLATRLDQTCLPFVRSGLYGDLMEVLAANAAYSMAVAIRKEFGG